MREQTYSILVSLLEGPLHGYRIIAAVRLISDDSVRLRAGTLYGALSRLTEESLVAVDREEVVNGRLRRYYRLTDAGVNAVLGETTRRERTTAQAARALRARGLALPGGERIA